MRYMKEEKEDADSAENPHISHVISNRGKRVL